MMTTDLAAQLEIVRSPRAKRVRLSIDARTGKVRLVVPPRASLKAALLWAEGHRSWIASHQAKLPEPWPVIPGMQLPFAGREYRLDWQETARRGPVLGGDIIQVGGPLEAMAPRLLRWMRREALTLLERETREIADFGGLNVTSVGVGDTRSRWGSCAANGVIRYSWRLILAPDFVRRATVAHEVAHLRHMNHSPAFHAEAQRLLGTDPAPARHWLRTQGRRLHWFGSGSS